MAAPLTSAQCLSRSTRDKEDDFVRLVVACTWAPRSTVRKLHNDRRGPHVAECAADSVVLARLGMAAAAMSVAAAMAVAAESKDLVC